MCTTLSCEARNGYTIVMDELLIEDRRYVSSKRAAKMTGYAKDYIGQLCREGRVPARLVGRSWYVLESAIRDHRFGANDVEPEKESPLSSTWESPHYESVPAEHVLPINRFEPQPVALPENETDLSQQLQDSWKAWFERISAKAPSGPQTETLAQEIDEVREPVNDEIIKDDTAVSVPVHTVYRRPPEELLPRQTAISWESEPMREEVYIEEAPRGRYGASRVVKTAGLIVAFVSLVLAVMGTGYFDKYILSNKPVSIMAGVILYDR